MAAFDQLIEAMAAGASWTGMGDGDRTRELLESVYGERYHRAEYNRSKLQLRVNLQRKADAASYAGWIVSPNPESGPYQGTSMVWFPGEGGSVAVLVIGTDGFGPDTEILGRPGHGRRLRALSRLHRGRIWVKPDLMDIAASSPRSSAVRGPPSRRRSRRMAG